MTFSENASAQMSAVRDAHARDASYHRGAFPDAVVFPKTNAEVAEIVKICAKYNMPIIPYGTGTGVEGAVVASEGALCIALNEMNRILRVSPDDRDATVQAGVTRLQLNTHLADLGTRLHFLCRSGCRCFTGRNGSNTRLWHKCGSIRNNAR